MKFSLLKLGALSNNYILNICEDTWTIQYVFFKEHLSRNCWGPIMCCKHINNKSLPNIGRMLDISWYFLFLFFHSFNFHNMGNAGSKANGWVELSGNRTSLQPRSSISESPLKRLNIQEIWGSCRFKKSVLKITKENFPTSLQDRSKLELPITLHIRVSSGRWRGWYQDNLGLT